MHPIDLFISTPGTRLGLDSKRLVIRDRDNNRIAQHPLIFLRSVTLDDHACSVSSALLAELADHGVSLTVCDFSGQPVGHFDFFLRGSWLSIQAQALAVADPLRAVPLMGAILLGKLHTQRSLLRVLAPRIRDLDLHHHSTAAISDAIAAIHTALALPHADLPAARATLMGHEGAAARAYWQALASSVDPLHTDPERFARQGRGADDPINASLNYGYAILLPRLVAMIHRAGLHPAGGLLHVPHGARPALALDLIEPYRPLVEDAVFGLIRRRKSPLPHDGLPQDWRQHIVSAVLDRLAAPASLDAKTFPVEACLQRTIRDLSSHLRDPAAHPDWQPWRWDVRGKKEPT